MRKYPRKMHLVRPADALLPLAMLAASARGYAPDCFILALCTLGARACALSTARSMRAAFARQPAMRDVQGSVKCALLAQPLGTAILTLVLGCISREWLAAPSLLILLSGLALNLEQVFHEYLYSTGDGRSAFISRLITAALCFAGVQLSAQETWPLLLMCALACLAACAVALAAGGMLKGCLNAEPLRCAPWSLVHDLAYPSAFGAMVWARPLGLFAHGSATMPAFFAGLTLYELCRTPFRRSKREARPMNLALAIVGALCLVLGGAALALSGTFAGHPVLTSLAGHAPTLAAAVLLAALCAFALFGNLGREA